MKNFYSPGLHVTICLSDMNLAILTDFNNIWQNCAIYDKMCYIAWDDMYVFIFLQDEIWYTLTGDSVAQQFFYINPNTGVITLKRLLTESDSSQYNVSEIKWRNL